MKKKFSILVITALVMMLTISACGAVSSLKSAGDVGKAFMDALKANDAETTWNMMTSELQQDLGAKADWQSYVSSNSFEDYKITSNEVANDTAVLEGEATINQETYYTELTFQKVDDGWMLVGISFQPQ